MTTAIVFLFLALSAMQASGDGDPTLADVVSAHEAALGSIHKIELTMRHDNRYFASGKPCWSPTRGQGIGLGQGWLDTAYALSHGTSRSQRRLTGWDL
ncbi:MAG: hypothetical protein FJ286_18485 [Planctomycetes bacterium]|nr:hypothetical protein [Planctomycetota bacterium]